jgi:hypothetical protein
MLARYAAPLLISLWAWGAASHAQAVQDTTIRAYKVHVPDKDIAEMQRRVRQTRWPDKETVGDESQGLQLSKLRRIVDRWGAD